MTQQTDRIKIEYTVRFTTSFHFGTGIREALVDRTVVRDGGGYLYVPGSTFKGVLRERCEQLARFYEQDTPEDEQVQSPHNRKTALWALGNVKPTLITRIFGSQNLPGRLYFDDAYQEQEAFQQYDSQDPSERDGKGKFKSFQVHVATQVRLDRLTRTAVQGALYTSEFGTNDLVFQGTIQGGLECTTIDGGVEHVQQSDFTPTYSLLLLLAGLRMVERLGGNKSTGKGHCECDITGVEINGKACTQDVWKSWLGQLDVLAHYHQLQEG